MFLNDQLYQAYVEEMEALENFRAAHTNMHKDTPVELVEDPDTLRLVESLAFFAARSRVHGLKKIAQIHQVLFRQYFSFLINPMPAMGLLQLQPSLRIPETVTLHEGTELNAHTYDERKAAFQTLNPITIPPLFFSSFNFYKHIKGGWRLELTFKANHSQTEQIEEMCLCINHLNNFYGSLRTFFALSRSIESIHVHYDRDIFLKKQGQNCTWRVGKPGHRKVFNHPLERIRSYLHFPEQEMFITIKIPPQTKEWKEISFFFELNSRWPEQMTLTKHSLVPYVVPIVNLKTAKSEPIICDGTKDSYPILYPNPSEEFSLHTILGVYELTAKGMQPLRPGILDKIGRTYEVDHFDQKIFLSLPNAFLHPSHVSIEALWAQLWFGDYIDQEFFLRLVNNNFSDLSPSLLRQMTTYEIPKTANDPKFLLRILSLKNQNRLKLSEVLFLMEGMKNLSLSHFRIVPPLIKDLIVKHQLDGSGKGPTLQYEFHLKEWDGRNWELVAFFFYCVNDFLNCWLANFHVETVIFFPKTKTPLIFKGGHDDELSLLARNFYLS